LAVSSCHSDALAGDIRAFLVLQTLPMVLVLYLALAGIFFCLWRKTGICLNMTHIHDPWTNFCSIIVSCLQGQSVGFGILSTGFGTMHLGSCILEAIFLLVWILWTMVPTILSSISHYSFDFKGATP